MNKKLTVVFSCILVFIFCSLTAQKKQEKEKLFAHHNIIKLNLSSLAARNIAPQYERVFNNKMSAALQIRWMPTGNMPMPGIVKNVASDSLQMNQINLQTICITPELRYYPMGIMKGYYIAPYYRYRYCSVAYPIHYINSNTNMAEKLDISGAVISWGGGVMFGYQMNLYKNWSLDLFILGVQFMRNNIDMVGKTTYELSDANRQDIYDKIKDAQSDRILKYNFEAHKKGVDIYSDNTTIGLRGLGLNLSYHF